VAGRDPSEVLSRLSHRFAKARVPHRQHAEPLLAWAAWNLDAAQFGLDVYELCIPQGDENFTGHRVHTGQFAALNLVLRGVVSAMDQCAAAVFRLSGGSLRADRERDVGWWTHRAAPPTWRSVPSPLRHWLRAFNQNSTWDLLSEARHAFTHRTVRRHVTLTIGVPKHGHDVFLDIRGTLHDADNLMPQALSFGRRRFSSFERAFAKAFPIR
jgi:hypothetical protein